MANILLIDDDVTVLTAIRRLLTAIGHKVRAAANGSEAMKWGLDEPTDLVITDMFMPELDGIGVMLQLQKVAPQVPIIAISGDGPSNILNVASKLGAVAVFEKPLATEEFLKGVEKALKR